MDNKESFLNNCRIKKSPISVCWDITNQCNANCEFCFRPLVINEIGIEKKRLILSKIINSGIRKITFTGGEPLLSDHITTLIKEAHNSGLITAIDTNGIMLKQRLEELVNYLDWITLPIDGSKDSVQGEMTREINHFNNTITLIEVLKKLHFSIKINTVISKKNIDDLPNIAKLINCLKIDRWKIFQFIPFRGYSIENAKQFHISDEQFNFAIDNLFNKLEFKPNCQVTIADRNYLQGNYFIILCDGRVRTTINNADVIAGNLLEQSVSELWESGLFNCKKHYLNRQWLLGNNSR